MEFKKIWKYHLLIAVFIIALDFFGDYVYKGKKGLFNNFEYANLVLVFYLVFFSTYFLNFYVLCPKTLKKKKVYKFIIGVIFLFMFFIALRYLLEEVILYQITGFHNYSETSRSLGYYSFDNTYFASKPILYSTILYLFFQFNENKNKIHQLELDHKKAEVSYLKSQISPHFLFNTLNAFYVELIDDKPKTAKDIHKLSELLRFVTYESQEDYISLKSELKFLEDYIYFYYKRFESELFVDFNVTGLVEIQQIPSLILIHFVENVFKHGIINEKANPAKINIHISEKYLELTTENKYSVSEKYTSLGIGSTNIERRLTVLYNTDYTLTYSDKNDYFSTYLKIPI